MPMTVTESETANEIAAWMKNAAVVRGRNGVLMRPCSAGNPPGA